MRPVVLYGEDEENDAIFMRLAFERVAPHLTLQVVEDGQQAIAYLSGEDPYHDRVRHPLPAVVVVDLNLPLLSGFDVVHWMRKHPELDGIPVLLFSSSGRPDDRKIAATLGANHYLVKPTSGDQFKAIAKEIAENWVGPIRS